MLKKRLSIPDYSSRRPTTFRRLQMHSDELRASHLDLDDRKARQGLEDELEKTTDTALTDIRAALASQKQARLERHGTPQKLGWGQLPRCALPALQRKA